MNARDAIKTLRETHKWLCNIQDHDDYTNTVLRKVCPSGTGFTAHSCAVFALEKCVYACEVISHIGKFNQYNLEDAIELARWAFKGE